MEQARGNGIDGVDESTRAPYRGLQVRHELASVTDSAYDALPSRAHRAGISCRKQHLAFVMDMNDIPWSWETPEAVLEERLRNTDPEAYRQFRQDREEA